jgi:hypothetical protein
MLNFIARFDFLGHKPELHINREERHKTFFGGVLSIITTGLIAAAAINFTVGLFQKANSVIIYNQIPTETVQLNISNVPFIIMLQDKNFKPIKDEERLYQPLINYWMAIPDNSSGTTVMKTEYNEILIERCDIDIHFGINRQYFAGVPFLEHHYCPIQNKNNITLYGVYGTLKPYSYLEAWITRCDNSTKLNKRRKCFDQEEINSKLENVLISFKFLDNSVNHQNTNNPYNRFLRSETIPVSTTIFKRSWYYFRNINYTLDQGLIFQSTEIKPSYQISKARETMDLRQEGEITGSFAEITLSMDNTIDSYYRSFEKAQDTLANVGGLYEGLMVIAKLINHLLTMELFIMELIKNIFSEFYSEEKKKTMPHLFRLKVPSINIQQFENAER